MLELISMYHRLYQGREGKRMREVREVTKSMKEKRREKVNAFEEEIRNR